MRVVGVDPGARQTGLVLIDYGARDVYPELLLRATIASGQRPMLQPSKLYRHQVQAFILEAVRDHHAELVAVEGVSAPKGFARGQRATLNPESVIACGIMLGVIVGRSWGVPTIVVPPASNGNAPWPTYPDPIRPKVGGKGSDARRHERSAYDVARKAPQLRALADADGWV